MAGNSAVEWTEATWNPIVGCSIKSPGCTNCYAMKMAARIEAMNAKAAPGRETAPQYNGTTRKVSGHAVWTGKLAQASDDVLFAPLRRKKPTTYFVNSMGDLFHEECPDEWIDRVFAVMALCPQHTFQVLTKRAARMRDYMANVEREVLWMNAVADLFEIDCSLLNSRYPYPIMGQREPWLPLPNVWLGVSTERQQEADERIPMLLQTPAAVRFISAEPLLGPIDLVTPLYTGEAGITMRGYLRDHAEPDDFHHHARKLDWVIVGGESGRDARPMHPQWPQSLRDQCGAAGVPFFFKQWGEFAPCDAINTSMRHALCNWIGEPPRLERDWVKALDFLKKSRGIDGAHVLARMGKSIAGRRIDGIEHNAMPELRR